MSIRNVGSKIIVFTSPADVIKSIDVDIDQYESLFNEYGDRLNTILKEVQKGQKKQLPEVKLPKKGKGGKVEGLDFKKLKSAKTDSSDDWITLGDVKVGRDERNEIWASVLLQLTEEIQDKLVALGSSKEVFTNIKNSGLLGNYDISIYYKDGIAQTVIPIERKDDLKHISISASFSAAVLPNGGEEKSIKEEKSSDS
ncbi:MAG: hypothetical protein QQN63_11395 [Nitrosopumilus sp.]